LAFAVLVGFMPIWLAVLLVFLISGHAPNWLDFVVHGEFAIYSAGLIATSARLISKDTESGPFVHRELFILATIVGTAISVGLYVTIKAATYLHVENTINQDFIWRFSFPLLLVSLAFAFLVFLLDNQRFNANVRAITKRQEDELEEKFDQLGDQHGEQ
jgi:hypothetical protein